MPFPILVAAFIAAIAAIGAAPVAHSDIVAVELDEIAFHEAELVIAGSEGEKTYSPEELEEFGTYRMVTTTPWRDDPATFEGVLLTDVLAAHGLEDAPAIRVMAENDYTVVIPREVWMERPVLIATRVDGRAHTRRGRGPLQFVFSMSDEPELGAQSFEANWVWMAARIEPVE